MTHRKKTWPISRSFKTDYSRAIVTSAKLVLTSEWVGSQFVRYWDIDHDRYSKTGRYSVSRLAVYQWIAYSVIITMGNIKWYLGIPQYIQIATSNIAIEERSASIIAAYR